MSTRQKDDNNEQTMAATRAAKKELRKALKATLASVEKDSVAAQSSKIVKTLFAQPEYQRAKRISVYLSMPSGEVHTPVIVRHALGAGKRVFVPYFYSVPAASQSSDAGSPAKKTMVMDMLELASLHDFETLALDAWGIPTPSEESIQHRANCFGGCGRSVDMPLGSQSGEGVDVVVTPGLGFDRACGRLGRGKGFYDRFFERCNKEAGLGARVPWKVGLSLVDQLLPAGKEIPMDGTDVRLDAVIAGDGSVFRRQAPPSTQS
ncbi:5-formyltetrahydrofolate cyclo-ligase [Verruconis gallopava]|uniref:5-formyltetrahydrofolate cyclo-ligase n=1 Tax=Verruconis gallopava TaxID=253628 RepID=A0A0D2AFY1_9PEZI|nr:5-formyltetrahydrofolate cyclo-ligase [Verruconis gallopava]KIW05883.1 5-formyltetrahydrofolate cyclo-ligase [Verruconis gallopava]